MRSGFNVGQIFGIKIDIDWSWLLIFLLVTWQLTAVVFPSLHPDWSLSLNIIVGLAASLLFFSSVLAHELAHSLVARARGLPVRRITLFIFGGVSNIEREPPSPGTEFLVAVVGPLTSILLGVLFIFLGGAIAGDVLTTLGGGAEALSQLGPVATLFIWLGPINLLLGVFNLIPGFPLDGGRLLRSILWASTDSLRTGTRWATRVGQAIAWLFIVTGVAMIFGVQIPFLGTGLLNGLWLAFIGWFLNNAATQSYRQVVVEDVLEGVTVERVMRKDTTSVSPDMLVSQLVDDYIMGTDERSFPVTEGEELSGLVTLEDVRKIQRSEWESTRVREIMTPAEQLETVRPNEDAVDALNKLSRRDVRQMPVVEQGDLIGMLRRQDIIRWFQLHSETGVS